MKLAVIDRTLQRLAELIQEDRFEDLETDTLELKPVPSEGKDWHKFHESACAFLNTRGGIIILGISEVRSAGLLRYRFDGWHSHAEPKINQLSEKFTDENGITLEIDEAFPPPQLLDFLEGRVAAVLVDELSADLKYAFYRGDAFKRVLTGDHKISPAEIDSQREFKESALQARELHPVPGVSAVDFDLDKLNDYIAAINKPIKIETIKADIESAVPFLERKCFLKNNVATTLGILVCGKHPGDRLEFRCQVHGYVEIPQEIARDKQDFVDNILPLMESSLAYLLRNIQVGVSPERGGTSTPQYPVELLRETLNNALAHRDYSINRQVILSIKPGRHIAIRNPGTFRRQLLLEEVKSSIPIRRILPEAKPRNPKLADVLRVFRKWEGRGIGMATMVNLSLQNQIDIPYYRFGTEEVTLYVCSGRLLDDRMKSLFQSFDRYISEKLNGLDMTEPQQSVMAYLIKSEWANEEVKYTILLTPDNNHFNELVVLEKSHLICKHDKSTSSHPIYVVDRELVKKDYIPQLREMFGIVFDALRPLMKEVLSVTYRFNHFSRSRAVSAKKVAFDLWNTHGQPDDIRAFDRFYRQVRSAFNLLKKEGFIEKVAGSHGYELSSKAGLGVLGKRARNEG